MFSMTMKAELLYVSTLPHDSATVRGGEAPAVLHLGERLASCCSRFVMSHSAS